VVVRTVPILAGVVIRLDERLIRSSGGRARIRGDGHTPDSIPGSMEAVARSVVADELRKERLVVFERLRRLGVQCLEAPYNRIGTDLINRYLAIKQREMI
jgi:hypothetical protein